MTARSDANTTDAKGVRWVSERGTGQSGKTGWASFHRASPVLRLIRWIARVVPWPIVGQDPHGRFCRLLQTGHRAPNALADLAATTFVSQPVPNIGQDSARRRP